MRLGNSVVGRASLLALGLLSSACGGSEKSNPSCTATQSAVLPVNLGILAPPTTMGGYAMQAFDLTPQAAIVNGTSVTTIPGSPIGGSLTLATALEKRTVPSGGWSTWSHAYAGPVFGTYTAMTTNTLTLPPGAAAFYFYIEPNTYGAYTITAATDSGATSGPISVDGSAGATGFGFAAPCGSTIASITVTVPAGANGFAIGEFGIGR